MPYAHLVSTLPHSFNAVYGPHLRGVIDTLFSCAAQTLCEAMVVPGVAGLASE